MPNAPRLPLVRYYFLMANNRLVRDKEHAMLGGVCAGIANRFDLDRTIVRIATSCSAS